MDYFTFSQSVKKEIERSGLLPKISQAFEGKFERFEYGTSVDLFYIGKLGSGLHVTLRIFRSGEHYARTSLETQINNMEIYCHSASVVVNNGYLAPPIFRWSYRW